MVPIRYQAWNERTSPQASRRTNSGRTAAPGRAGFHGAHPGSFSPVPPRPRLDEARAPHSPRTVEASGLSPPATCLPASSAAPGEGRSGSGPGSGDQHGLDGLVGEQPWRGSVRNRADVHKALGPPALATRLVSCHRAPRVFDRPSASSQRGAGGRPGRCGTPDQCQAHRARHGPSLARFRFVSISSLDSTDRKAKQKSRVQSTVGRRSWSASPSAEQACWARRRTSRRLFPRGRRFRRSPATWSGHALLRAGRRRTW